MDDELVRIDDSGAYTDAPAQRGRWDRLRTWLWERLTPAGRAEVAAFDRMYEEAKERKPVLVIERRRVLRPAEGRNWWKQRRSS